MKMKLLTISLTAILFLAAGDITRPEAVDLEGSPGGGSARESEKRELVRMPVDTVGYATVPADVESVVAMARKLGDTASGGREGDPSLPDGVMIGAICPHDDYLYAGPGYVDVMERVTAPVAVIFGVCHACRRSGIEGKLIFDGYRAWKGPYGDCRISGLREDLIEALPAEYVTVSGEIHSREHSIESFIPFLQYPGFASEGRSNSKISIVPVLVTRFGGSLQGKVAGLFASALKEQMERRGWILGRDLVILISADCVHYGDSGWGGRNYAPFGTGRDGYRKAVKQEMKIIDASLTGRIDSGKVSLFREMVERDDLEWPYKVTWCGVYSIPFGLTALARLSELSGRDNPEGFLLRYATSLDAPEPEKGGSGLGSTNISTLRHWVGYAAVGYW